MPEPTPSRDIAGLIEIMARLRTPVTGCPWDLEQTFATIAPYTIEEAYEVADAIARGDPADLRDELGDLLLQVVYHARLAQEQGTFEFGDVVEAITAKMIRRHPHVFGDAHARDAGAVAGFWDRIKAEERVQKASERQRLGVQGETSGADAPDSILADVPMGFPALTRAIKLQDKAAKVGFDGPSLTPVLDKVREEIGELEQAVAVTASPTRQAAIAEEYGDLLFVLANVGRHLQVDPEAALRAANDKFRRRFQHIETTLAGRGSSPERSSLEEMDAIWNEAKVIEQNS